MGQRFLGSSRYAEGSCTRTVALPPSAGLRTTYSTSRGLSALLDTTDSGCAVLPDSGPADADGARSAPTSTASAIRIVMYLRKRLALRHGAAQQKPLRALGCGLYFSPDR